ncbi:hypothetical protein [Citrifermentans bemidjiense]|uniref:hypothetical protein n=1 Tax=Citrifermentans bemidjiense TaxID=225194 RepID=UPI00145CA874|nr:hypothetical protein [Citrifermentans bemidjiense]
MKPLATQKKLRKPERPKAQAKTVGNQLKAGKGKENPGAEEKALHLKNLILW